MRSDICLLARISPASQPLKVEFGTVNGGSWGFPGDSDGKESACNARGPAFDPWVGKIPWRREWQPTPVFLPGEFRGQEGPNKQCSSWGCRELNTTESYQPFHFQDES